MTQTQTEADRPDRYPPETDPTRPEVVDGRRRVVKHFTRFRRVGSGLGTNPTRTDPWTALDTINNGVGLHNPRNRIRILDLIIIIYTS